MFRAEAIFLIATAIAVVAPCALADSGAHTTAAPPSFCGPPGTPPPGPPLFPPAMGFAHSGGMMFGPGAGPPMPPPPPDMQLMMALGVAGSDLTDQQIASMAAMQRSFHNDIEPIRSKLHQLEEALQQELFQDNIDVLKVKQLQDQLQDQRSQLDKASGAHVLQMAQALTPEQRKKVRQHMDKMTLGPAAFRHP